MTNELDVIEAKIDELEVFLRGTPLNEQTAAVVIAACNAVGGLRQAKALHGVETQLEELAGYLGGVISLLDTPGISSLLAQFGIGSEDEEGADEGEEDGDGDEDDEDSSEAS